jgi:diadenosine tetraphosphatase ApaH/serine/threonine PP2A family protein phosphatase
VAILSDVHANLEALLTVRDHARRLGADEVWVLGDLVGYGADPAPVLDIVKEMGTRVLCGNHDLAAIERFDVSWFNDAAAQAIRWTQEQLGEKGNEYLSSLEPRLDDGALLVHGSVRDPVAEYVVDVVSAGASFRDGSFDLCFFGHTHLPSVFALEGERVTGAMLSEGDPIRLRTGVRYLLNPGSVGQPRDGDPRASFMLYDDGVPEAVVHRVPYPVERAQEKIVAAGLPRWLAERLSIGE